MPGDELHAAMARAKTSRNVAAGRSARATMQFGVWQVRATAAKSRSGSKGRAG